MNTKELTKISICTALICISSYISFYIPFTPIMITSQTVVINLVALILKPKNAFLSVLMFILIGVLGIPVFSGGTAGIGRLFGPTGGFMMGFLLSAPIMSILRNQEINLKRYLFISAFIGMPIIYLTGSAWVCISQNLDIISALKTAVIPFIIGDIIKCFISSVLAIRLNRISFVNEYTY